MRIPLLAAALCLCTLAAHGETPLDTRALVASHRYPFTLDANNVLVGPGAEHLQRETGRAQYLLFGESHHDYDTPRLASGIYRMLRATHGFDALVVEQDPLAIESINQPPLRGDVKQIAALVRRYPMQLGFASDQDLAFLADASQQGPVWGVEQAQGVDRYLDELRGLASNPALESRVAALYEEAHLKETRNTPGAFIHDDATTLPRLEMLQADFGAAPGSRAAELLDRLVETARIYSYNRRGMAGEYVGLYNNTEREALFKRHFVRHYKATAQDGVPLKAMFKFGAWHMYRGKSPGRAYTIGNFAHEHAIWNGLEGYGVYVIAVGGHGAWEDIPTWLHPLLPDELPKDPLLIDLRPLKPYDRPLRETVAAADQAQFQDLLLGFDAIIILPNSRKATWELTQATSP
jgi:hypothetical protein